MDLFPDLLTRRINRFNSSGNDSITPPSVSRLNGGLQFGKSCKGPGTYPTLEDSLESLEVYLLAFSTSYGVSVIISTPYFHFIFIASLILPKYHKRQARVDKRTPSGNATLSHH